MVFTLIMRNEKAISSINFRNKATANSGSCFAVVHMVKLSILNFISSGLRYK